MSEVTPVVTLMVEAAAIPENSLRQMQQWKLLPEDATSGFGAQQLRLKNSWSSLEEFIDELRVQISKELTAFRETELDQAGEYVDVWLHMSDGTSTSFEAYLDHLGRLVLPGDDYYEHVSSVTIDGERKDVVRMGPRYKGKTRSVWVCYLGVLSEEDTNRQLRHL